MIRNFEMNTEAIQRMIKENNRVIENKEENIYEMIERIDRAIKALKEVVKNSSYS
jgi:Na+/phosphate symporter